MACRKNAVYYKSYRRVRANVQAHISAIYADNTDMQEIENPCSSKTFEPEPVPTLDAESCISDNSITMLTAESDTLCGFDTKISEQPIQGQDAETGNFELDFEDLNSLSYLSDSDLESNPGSDISLENELQTWASTFKVPHSAIQSLLSILRVYHPFLPKDPRTLLKTATKYDVFDIDGGSYYHFGLAPSLLKLVENRPNAETSDLNSVLVQFNIDGLPLFKSTSTQFWPILCRVIEPFECKPFIVGLYSGNRKPGNVQEYLQLFRDEIEVLIQNGIQFSNSVRKFAVEISCFICDAPARAFVKQTKGHSGYFGCDKCSQRGRWVNKMTFPEVNAPLRTDVQFDTFQNEEHHTGYSPFSGLPIGMVSQFPIDYMHLVCLGVTRRLLMLWIKGPLFCRQGAGFIAQISMGITDMKAHLPREFLRKGRTLKEIDRWKASEFRLFLLYIGPIILRARLPDRFYKHFMLLSVAIYCLASPVFCQVYCGYAKQLLCLFVSQVEELYGESQYVYNIHGLVHLADDVSRYGALDKFSSFVYESFLGRLKRLVRKPNFPLQQVIRRLSEDCLNDCQYTSIGGFDCGIVNKQHQNGPLPRVYSTYMQFEQLNLSKSYFLSVKQGNNCILAGDKVGIIRNILSPSENSHERILLVENFRNLDNFYTEPLLSSDIRIFRVGHLTGDIVAININEVSCKCVLLPYRNNFIAVPLIHCFL